MKTFQIGEYRESFGPSLTGEQFTGETNWEPDIGEPETQAAARTIPVTPEMQARDAAERAAREARPQTTWSSFRDTLSEDNLRKVRRPVGAGRKEGRSAIPAPTPKPAQPVRSRPVPRAEPKSVPAPLPIVAAIPITQEEKIMPEALPFKIGSPVPTASILQHGTKPSIYQPVFDALLNLSAGLSLPIEVANARQGGTVDKGLRLIAKRCGRKLRFRRDAAGTTFFFRLDPKEESTK